MNLAQQKRTNRHGDKGRSARGLDWKLSLKTIASRFLLFSQTFAFVVFLLWQYGTLSVNQDLAGWWWTRQTQAKPAPTQIIEAIDHGVYPSDRQDDSRALQTLIDNLPPRGTIQINLPLGEIDLFHPIALHRSHTALHGKGVKGTLLQAHHQALGNNAILTVSPSPTSNMGDTVDNIQLENFTIELAESTQSQAFTSISLDHVVGATLKHLNLSAGGKQTLVLSQSRDITVEYVDLGVL